MSPLGRIVWQMRHRPKPAAAIRLTLAAFRKHHASRFGAALAFYIVFSIAPTLLIAIAIAGSLIGRPRAKREILDRIGGSFESAAAVAVATMIKDAAPQRVGWLATTLGFMTLCFGLAGVYRQIEDALRTIWGEAPEKPAGMIHAIRKKLSSMLLVVAAGAVVLLSVMFDAAIAVTGRYAADRLWAANCCGTPRSSWCRRWC